MDNANLNPNPIEYGRFTGPGFWVEYPSAALLDLTRSAHPQHPQQSQPQSQSQDRDPLPPPLNHHQQWQLPIDTDRTLRINKLSTAILIIDMQNFFLHPDLRHHPSGLSCVDPLLNTVPALRSIGAKIIWLNWGLTDHELSTIPPALVRSFMKGGKGGFGSLLPPPFGRLLIRHQHNSQLYGPLQHLYEQGKETGSDVWIIKTGNMSGLWGPQSALDLYLQEQGITTLLFAGVNADQCVLGTLVDAYFRGYDCIVLRDAIATTSPAGAYENVIYNSTNSYGFVTDTNRVIAAATAASTAKSPHQAA